MLFLIKAQQLALLLCFFDQLLHHVTNAEEGLEDNLFPPSTAQSRMKVESHKL
jgi:hypothetical protein